MTDSNGRSPGITFVIYQNDSSSNGGMVSLGEIIARAPAGDHRVITNLDPGFTRQWERYGQIIYWPMSEGAFDRRWGRFGRPLLRIANNVRTFLDVRRHRGNIVHVNSQQAMWNSGLGAKLAGAKVLFNVRDGMREGANPRRWKLFLRLADQFLVLSGEMEDDWRGRLAPLAPRESAKFRHLYSIVDRDRFSPHADRAAVRAELGLPEGPPVLVYAGRFEPKKAQLAFIREGLPRIVAARPDAVVHFLGDFEPDRNSYAAACDEAVRELGLTDHVHFAGHTSSIAAWYQAADLVLLASQREGLARCMIEGIACGTPVVSFDVCSAREILEGHGTGVVVAQGDYDGFAAATAALLDDDATRAELGARGPRVAAELFDPGRIATGYTSLVAELAA